MKRKQESVLLKALFIYLVTNNDIIIELSFNTMRIHLILLRKCTRGKAYILFWFGSYSALEKNCSLTPPCTQCLPLIPPFQPPLLWSPHILRATDGGKLHGKGRDRGFFPCSLEKSAFPRANLKAGAGKGIRRQPPSLPHCTACYNYWNTSWPEFGLCLKKARLSQFLGRCLSYFWNNPPPLDSSSFFNGLYGKMLYIYSGCTSYSSVQNVLQPHYVVLMNLLFLNIIPCVTTEKRVIMLLMYRFIIVKMAGITNVMSF